jgi:hypothetical protein
MLMSITKNLTEIDQKQPEEWFGQSKSILLPLIQVRKKALAGYISKKTNTTKHQYRIPGAT